MSALRQSRSFSGCGRRGRLGDVVLGARSIAERDAMHRHVAADDALQRPLIRIDQPLLVAKRGGLLGHEAAHLSHGLIGAETREGGSAPRANSARRQDGMKPLPVLRVRYADPQQTWLYLDPERGVIAQRYERATRWSRWLYHGFHSLDFPFLYYKRPLWDLVVWLLSLGGIAISVTSALPAWRRLGRHVRGLFVPRRTAAPAPRASIAARSTAEQRP